MHTTQHPLTTLPAALMEAGYEATSYRALYDASVNNKIPVKRQTNGRWYFHADDLPQIAEAMGLADAHAA